MGLECNQCGECCQKIAVDISPYKLKVAYNQWFKQKKKKKWSFSDIHLLYPSFVYKGFSKKKNRHIYSCKHLKKERGTEKYICTIYAIRPKNPCVSFGEEAIKTGKPLGPGTKKLYPKCSLC